MENKETQTKKVRKPSSLPTNNVTRVRTNAIATSFTLMKIITMSLIAFSTIVVGGAYWIVTIINQNANSRAFFITETGTMMGSSQYDYAKARGFEIENHIRIFTKSMFQFDQGNFDSNVEKALHLIGDDGKIIYNRYITSNMKETLVKNNAKISVSIDSIRMISDKEPYKYKMYARQSIETSMGLRQQYLWAEYTLTNVSRTENNFHGLMIDSFDLKNNELVPRSLIEQELQRTR